MIKNVYIKNGLINTVFKILSAVNFLVKKTIKDFIVFRYYI